MEQIVIGIISAVIGAVAAALHKNRQIEKLSANHAHEVASLQLEWAHKNVANARREMEQAQYYNKRIREFLQDVQRMEDQRDKFTTDFVEYLQIRSGNGSVLTMNPSMYKLYLEDYKTGLELQQLKEQQEVSS